MTQRRKTYRRLPQHLGMRGAEIVEGDIFASLLRGDRSYAADAANLLDKRVRVVPLQYSDVVELSIGQVINPKDFADRHVLEAAGRGSIQSCFRYVKNALGVPPAFLLGAYNNKDEFVVDFKHSYFVGSVITDRIRLLLQKYMPAGTADLFNSIAKKAKEKERVRRPVIMLLNPICGHDELNQPRCLDFLPLPDHARIVSAQGLIHFVMRELVGRKEICGAAIKKTEDVFTVRYIKTGGLPRCVSIPDESERAFLKRRGVRLG